MRAAFCPIRPPRENRPQLPRTARPALAIAAISLIVGTARAAEPVVWFTGTALEKQLAAPVSLAWTNMPLGRGLANLSASQHVAIVLDRRVDPEQPINLTLSPEPMAKIIRHIAERARLGYSQLGAVAYVGPPATARKLRTLSALRGANARRAGPSLTRKLLAARRWHWDDLSEPRQLVHQLAGEAGVTIAADYLVAHDLWGAADLPAMSWIDRLTLVAAQFDLTFDLAADGKVELVPMPPSVELARTYPAGRDVEELAQRFRKEFPDARVSVEGNRIRLVALVEDHDAAARLLHPGANPRTTITAGRQTHRLGVEAVPLDRVLSELTRRLNLDIRLDKAAIEAAGISTGQLVTVKVEDADLDQLLTAVLKGTGLTYRREETRIAIVPAERPAN